jgi:hypothetical protein
MRRPHKVPELLAHLGVSPSSSDSMALSIRCGEFLKEAARAGDRESCRRGLEVVLWLDEQVNTDESFIYVCQDVLRGVIESPRLRAVFASVLSGREFSQIRGYVEFLSSLEVASEMSTLINSTKRGS